MKSKRLRLRQLGIDLSNETGLTFKSNDIEPLMARYTLDEIGEIILILKNGGILKQIKDTPAEFEWISKFDPTKKDSSFDIDN